MRAATLACATALLLAACGSGSGDLHKPTTRVTHSKPISAAVIVRAARRTARQRGYAVSVKAGLETSALGGEATLVGSGKFNNTGVDGAQAQLNATATLPGTLSYISPVTTTVDLAGSTIYVKLPSQLAALLRGKVKPWVTDPVNSLLNLAGISAQALAGQLTPRRALDALADASQGGVCDTLGSERVDGHSYVRYREQLKTLAQLGWVYVTVDPGTGLIRQISARYSPRTSGPKGDLTVTFTAFGEQQIAPVPSASQTTSLSRILAHLRF